MQFNISHCKSGAAAVVSSREVGVDMEALRKVNACIVRKCCSKKEAAYVFLENDTNGNMDKILTESEARRFLHLWTLKESFVKMTGDGLSVPFHEICFEPAPLTGLTDGRICQISGPCRGAKHFLYTKRDFSVALTVQCGTDENPDFIWKLYDKQEIETALETVTYLHPIQNPL